MSSKRDKNRQQKQNQNQSKGGSQASSSTSSHATNGVSNAQQIKALEAERDELKKQLEEAQSAADSTREQLEKQLEKQQKEAEERHQQLERQLEHSKRRLEQVEKSLKDALAEKERQHAEDQKKLASLRHELDETKRPSNLRHVIVQLEAKKSGIEADIKAADAQYTSLIADWEQLQDRRVALEKSEGEVSQRESAVTSREAEQKRWQLKLEGRDKQQQSRELAVQELEKKLEAIVQSTGSKVAEQKQQALEQERRERALRHEEGLLKQQQKSFDEAQIQAKTQLFEWEAKLRTLESDLRERELSAEAGFVLQQRVAIERLEADVGALRDHLSRVRGEIAHERVAWEQQRRDAEAQLAHDLERRREEAEADVRGLLDTGRRTLEQETQELETQRQELLANQKALRQLQRQLEADRENLDEDREALEQVGQQLAARTTEKLETELKAETERLAVARAARQELQARLDAREEADRCFGQKGPEEVLAELQRLRKSHKSLEEKLAQRMSEADSIRLRELEERAVIWEAERDGLKRELGQTRGHLEANRASVLELEGLRKHKEALEATQQLLQSAVDELKAKVHELTAKAEGQPVFPTCFQMDIDDELQRSIPPEELSHIGMDPTQTDRKPEHSDLGGFTHWLQQKLAHGSLKMGQLHYSLRDLRLFLGGLAMSRLHVLQGISGTGKTSLPTAFAAAIGAGLKIIPVQAGWRDRQDLLGHYNAFERRFHETLFLQALYEASTPYYQDKPYLIVLDELNLSRPEQYFADFISLFEQPEGARRIELMSQRIEPAPKKLEGGRFLPLPQNVWFIGTANHDETTLELADKTYDRAHVMELPRHREVVPESSKVQEPDALALRALERAFEKARRERAKEAGDALKWLETSLREPLYEHFRIGWGNRLERQAKAFIPVVLAAGGSVGEAIDHLLSTRLLRRIKDRHDVRTGNYQALQKVINTSWTRLETGNVPPERSLQLIEQELKRLSFDRVDEEQA